MSTDDATASRMERGDRDAYTAGRDQLLYADPSAAGYFEQPLPSEPPGEYLSAAAPPELGVLRIEIHGSWSVGDLIELLERLEDGYKAAAVLQSLSEQPSGSTLSQLSADDMLQTVTAFRLAGGLRLGSLQYGSPGHLECSGNSIR